MPDNTHPDAQTGLFERSIIRRIVILYSVSRIILFLVAMITPNLNDFLFENPGWEKSFVQMFDPQKANIIENLCITDCRSYIQIAKEGYETSPNRLFHYSYTIDGEAITHPFMVYANWAFFPLLPLLLASLHALTGLDHVMVGFLLSQGMALVGFFVFYAYVRQGWGRSTADQTLFYYAFWPIGVYMSVPMTEALFTPLVLGIFLAARRQAWLVVAVLAFLLSGLRVVGCLIALPLLLIAIRQYGWRAMLTFQPGTEKALFALLASGLGLAAYMLFLHERTGDALAFSHIQAAWWRQVEWPWVRVLDALNPLKLLEGTELHIILQVQVLLALWAFAVSLRLLRQNKAEEWLYFFICLMVGLASDNITSLIRFISVHVYLIIPWVRRRLAPEGASSPSSSITGHQIIMVALYGIWSLFYLSKANFAV